MKRTMILALVALVGFAAFAAEEAEVKLWPEGKMPLANKNQEYAPWLKWHVPAKRTTDAVMICVSGGGYYGSDVNGFEVAPMKDYLVSKGMTVVTMRYRAPRPKSGEKHTTAWADAQRTVRIVRSECAKRGLDPEKIGFTGCSAGGHLTMLVACSSTAAAYRPVDELDKVPCHVNFAAPVYPAYVLTPERDGPPDVVGCDDLTAKFVGEIRFDRNTPPMCFVHGDSDHWSPMASVRSYHKLREMGIPAELHVMANETHCFHNAPLAGTPPASWKDRVWEWLVNMDFVTENARRWEKGWRDAFPAGVRDAKWNVTWDGIVSAKAEKPLAVPGKYEKFIFDFEYRFAGEKEFRRHSFFSEKGAASKFIAFQDGAIALAAKADGKPVEYRRLKIRNLGEDKGFYFPARGDAVEMAKGAVNDKDLTVIKGGIKSGAPIILQGKGYGAKMLPIVAADCDKANWLAEAIEKMTGKKPKVLWGRDAESYTNKPAIFIGNVAAFRQLGEKIPGTPDTRLGTGAHAFRCFTRNGSIFLIGPNKTANDYAVCDFAERVLGIRSYYWIRLNQEQAKKPGAFDGTDYPKMGSIAVPQFDWADEPIYEFRTEFAAGHPLWKFGDAHQAQHTVHAPSFWNSDPNLNFAGRWSSNKDILQLEANGERGRTPMLCYGNPKTLRIYKEHLKLTIEGKRRGFRGDPVDLASKTLTVSQWDAAVNCCCDYCKKLVDKSKAPTGDASPIIWGYFTRELSDWLAKEYPDWVISFLPYINTCDVPKGLTFPAKNAEAYLCTMPGLALLKNEDVWKHETALMREWRQATGRKIINWHYICWPADTCPVPYIFGKTANKFYREMKDVVYGSFLNGGYPMDRLGLSAYVWVRSMWNPNLDVDKVYDVFAERMFGAAAPEMRQVVKMQEDGWMRQWKNGRVCNKNLYGVSYPRAEVLEMARLIDVARAKLADDVVHSNRLAYYVDKPFERMFKESAEYESGTAFSPFNMKKAVQPKIDGALDDDCWKTAEPIDFVDAMCKTNPTPKYATQMKAVWNEQGVTLGVKCFEPTPQFIRTKYPVGEWWGNDCLEIFIDPTGDADGMFVKIWVDAAGGHCFSAVKGVKWEPKNIKIASKINEDSWTTEVFLPFSDFVKDFPNTQVVTTQGGGKQWNGNMCRLRIADAWEKEKKTPGSVYEMTRPFTRYSGWNKDPNAFGAWKFVE